MERSPGLLERLADSWKLGAAALLIFAAHSLLIGAAVAVVLFALAWLATQAGWGPWSLDDLLMASAVVWLPAAIGWIFPRVSRTLAPADNREVSPAE